MTSYVFEQITQRQNEGQITVGREINNINNKIIKMTSVSSIVFYIEKLFKNSHVMP